MLDDNEFPNVDTDLGEVTEASSWYDFLDDWTAPDDVSQKEYDEWVSNVSVSGILLMTWLVAYSI